MPNRSLGGSLAVRQPDAIFQRLDDGVLVGLEQRNAARTPAASQNAGYTARPRRWTRRYARSERLGVFTMRRGLLVLLVCAAGALGQLLPAALAANGPGLGSEYEELVAQPSGYGDGDTIAITNVQCNPGGVSSFDVYATGTAYGSQYPGTFEETATVSIAPGGSLQSFDASFTIYSGETTVHGTKSLYADDPDRYSSGFCSGTYAVEPGSCDSLQQISASTKYEATITRASGSFTDYGVATVELAASQPGCGGVSVGSFIETFVASSITLPVPGSLTLRQTSDVNEVGTSHTVTAYVATEDETQTVGGATVYFSVSGSASASGVCATDFYGLCDFSYQGPTFPGSDVIGAYVDVNNNGTQDAGEPTSSVTKQWVLPASTAGQASGSGKVGTLAFELSAKSDKGVKGTCSVTLDKTTVKCLDVTSYVQTGNSATIYGHATVNGATTLYKITVIDNGRPGAGKDVFTIETASGFTGGGTLTAGNVDVG